MSYHAFFEAIAFTASDRNMHELQVYRLALTWSCASSLVVLQVSVKVIIMNRDLRFLRMLTCTILSLCLSSRDPLQYQDEPFVTFHLQI